MTFLELMRVVPDPISALKKAISDLEHGKVNHELLTRSVKLSKIQKNIITQMIVKED